MSSTDDKHLYPHGYMATHAWDWETDYCTRCGMSRAHAVNRMASCVDPDSNVTGISHRISKRRLERLSKRLTDGRK